jgi:hypothetical protein
MKVVPFQQITKVLYYVGLFLAITSLPSCIHKKLASDFTTQIPVYKHTFNFSSAKDVKSQLREVGDLKSKLNQIKLIQFLTAYRLFEKDKAMGIFGILPFSKIQFTVDSFCGSSIKATPAKSEKFQWKKGLPQIDLLKEILSLHRKSNESDRNKIQEIIWNLENGTLFDQYPDEQKKILLEASPSAPLILPSKIKNELSEMLIPENFRSVISLVKGRYYSFDQFKSQVNQLSSGYPTDDKPGYFKIPDSNLYAVTESIGFERHVVSLYNPSNKPQSIDIKSFYLYPLRTDVQPVLLTDVMPEDKEIKYSLEKAAVSLLGVIGSEYPTLNKEEKQLVKDNPIEAAIVFYSALKAEQIAEEEFPNSKPNGASDALRHFVWSGFLVRDIGEDRAIIYLKAHESTPGQSPAEFEMDSFNNNQGVIAAKDLISIGFFEDSKILEIGKSQLSAGNLKVLSK